uniref:Uncharacterized protein n=1 Tax=Electrophorus electricus TaxID=8005 RepID=A0AAY5F0E3_ELEEL
SSTADEMQVLEKYISDTFRDIATVRKFCDREPKWTLQRKSELRMMRDIKDRAKSKAEELEKELGSALKDTLEGLKKLHHFLDALERLSVTSVQVFRSESIVPRGLSAKAVQSLIFTIRSVSPLLIHFKRDAAAFFMPFLCNVEVLVFQLDKYIQITNQLCKIMKHWENSKPSLEFILNMSEESVCNLHAHLEKLNRIRMDESFRLTFLFSGEAQRFIDVFSQHGSRMFQLLSDLEEAAVQLDRMVLGSSISTVVGSSVGIAGTVLSTVGLVLAPVTAGLSLTLTLTGAGLGVSSGVTSMVTGVTEMAVNSHEEQNANNIFISFMEHVLKVLDCMEQAANIEGPVPDPQEMVNMTIGTDKVSMCTGKVAKDFNKVFLGQQKVILQMRKAAASITSLAADLPDTGKLAKGTTLILSKSARAGLRAGPGAVLSIGMDALSLYNESISLAEGKKNETSELIRNRSALWRSEVKAWEKIYNCLCEGISNFDSSKNILQQPFYH